MFLLKVEVTHIHRYLILLELTVRINVHVKARYAGTWGNVYIHAKPSINRSQSTDMFVKHGSLETLH